MSEKESISIFCPKNIKFLMSLFSSDVEILSEMIKADGWLYGKIMEPSNMRF